MNYNNYFDNESHEIYQYDVGSYCTRKAVTKQISKNNGNLLEIGIGLNTLLGDLQHFNCYGIDISETTIEKASAFFKLNNIQANLKIANAEKLPFEDNFFDVIVSTHTLEHIENDLNVLKECLRILKPTGEAIFFVPGSIDGKATKQEWIENGHYRRYNTKRIHDLVNNLNNAFKIESITFPHKIHNLIWCKALKNLTRYANYPVKKYILRDYKTYELRPTYQKLILPAISLLLDSLDKFTHSSEKNTLGAEFNVMFKIVKR